MTINLLAFKRYLCTTTKILPCTVHIILLFGHLLKNMQQFSRQMKSTWCEVRLRSQFRKKPLKQYGAPWTQYRRVEIHSIFRLSCNIQTLFYWGQKSDLYTSYHIRLISYYKDLKTNVVSWFSLVIRQNASRQLATSSENLVASAQFLVALATSESQFSGPELVLEKQAKCGHWAWRNQHCKSD